MDKDTTVEINAMLFCTMFISLIDLKMNIECLPKHTPLIWYADGETPVIELKNFKELSEVLNEANIIYEKITGQSMRGI